MGLIGNFIQGVGEFGGKFLTENHELAGFQFWELVGSFIAYGSGRAANAGQTRFNRHRRPFNFAVRAGKRCGGGKATIESGSRLIATEALQLAHRVGVLQLASPVQVHGFPMTPMNRERGGSDLPGPPGIAVSEALSPGFDGIGRKRPARPPPQVFTQVARA